MQSEAMRRSGAIKTAVTMQSEAMRRSGAIKTAVTAGEIEEERRK
jgi:hypothetical protein